MAAVRAWIAAHRKTITALTGVAISLAVGYWGTSNQWVELAILAATVLGVYGVKNEPTIPVSQPPGGAASHPGGTGGTGGSSASR